MQFDLNIPCDSKIVSIFPYRPLSARLLLSKATSITDSPFARGAIQANQSVCTLLTIFCGCSLTVTNTGMGWFVCIVVLWLRAPTRPNRQWVWFKTSKKMSHGLKSHQTDCFLWQFLGCSQYFAERFFSFCCLMFGNTRRLNRQWFWL